MQFSLATPEDSKKVLSSVSKVKAHLTTGIVEILDKHQDLLGKISINIVEIESNEENKNEKLKFILQDALIIVSTKGLTTEPTTAQTGVYIFAKRALELQTNISIDEFSKKVEQKSLKLETQKQVLSEATGKSIEKIKTQLLLLEDELEFDKKVLSFIKETRS